MAQILKSALAARIKQLQDELNTQPPEKHETVTIAAIDKLCDVIKVDAQDLLLNHASHRIKTQLEDDAEWQRLKSDPTSEEAQELIARMIRADHKNIQELERSLRDDGQEQYGVITHDGVLINGNTRAIIMRTFKPAQREMRVAVLPATVTPQQRLLIENRYQTQRELRGQYSMTNFLLMAEDLRHTAKMEPEDVADELRIPGDNQKKRGAEVQTYLRILDLLRHMRQMTQQPLPLNWFNRVKLENMKGVLSEHDRLLKEEDGETAERYLWQQLLSWSADVTSVHQIRHVDENFVDEYVVAQLEDDPESTVSRVLVKSLEQPAAAEQPSGVKALQGRSEAQNSRSNVATLVNMLTHGNSEYELTIENKKFKIDVGDAYTAINAAIINGIKEKKSYQLSANKLEAPSELLKKASAQMLSSLEAIKLVSRDPQFNAPQKNKIGQAFRTLRKRMREVEAALIAAGIIAKS